MADKEMYDYLSTVTPTYTTTTLSISPQGELRYAGRFPQNTHITDDGVPHTISKGSVPYFDVFIRWDILTSSDAGTVMDFYLDANKAKGMEKSFYWDHPVDGHTYVAMFMTDFSGIYKAGWGTKQAIPELQLRIIGKKA